MREFLATTAILALVVATPALAQDAGAPPPSPTAQSDNAGANGDIIITARKREESIRDVPGTISAVTGDQLDAKGPIAGSGDILSLVPAVRFNDVASENLAEISIRGSGTQRATGADSAVGLFVNGAYVGSSTLGGRNFKTLDYFDIERVEALEGPQGALYGRNSEFGAINIVQAKPKFQDSGYVRNMFTFGLDQNRLAIVSNHKLSEHWALRLGAEVYGQEKGFYYDPNHQTYYDQTRGWNGRAALRYRGGALDVTLTVDGQDLKLPSFVNSLVVPGGGVNAQIPLGYNQSRFIVPHTGEDSLQQKVIRSTLSVSYDLGGATLESTTMFTRWGSHQRYAAAIDVATAIQLRTLGEIGIYPYAQVRTDVRDRTWYQDLHLTGKALGGNLNWIVGGEGLYQNDNYRITVASSPCAFTLAGSFCGGQPGATFCVKPLPTSTSCPATFPLTFGTDSTSRQRIYSFAGYASLSYKIGNLTVSGEGRLTHDYKTATQTIYQLYTTTLTKVPTTYVFKKDQPTFTFTVSYQTTDPTRTLLYAKVGNGYRAGGVNNGTFNALAPNLFVPTYENETTISYEVGIKSQIVPQIFVKLDGYLSRTSDAITSINDGCTPTNLCGTGQQFFNVNGGTIHARGLEASVEGRFKIGDSLLSINANISTQRAFFANLGSTASGLPILGSPVAQIPDWSMSGSIDYRFPIAKKVRGFVNFSYSGQRGGSQDTVTVATPYIPMENFDIFGTRVGVNVNKFQFAFFVRNLFDEQVEVLKFLQVGYPLSVRYNKPRTMGLSASYRW